MDGTIMTDEHEKIEFDVLFVGGGPASLAGAIRLMQRAKEDGRELEVALIEKGADIGAHEISGAVLNPIALTELIPDYREKECPIETTVREDEFYFLTRESHYRLPLTPRYMRNKGCHIISLSRFTRWLGTIAEALGVNIFPGFAGTKVLFDADGKTVTGVRTGDKGFDKEGQPKSNFEPGIDLMAKVTVFGEGARGSLVREIEGKLGLYVDGMPPVYETGIKEVIQLPEDNYFTTSEGNDIHVLGYPLGLNTPGGGFIYEMKANKIAIGYLTALSYRNPALDPYDAFIRFKKHPFVAGIISFGKVVEQGARTVSTGGFFSIPKLATDGAVFIGGCASMHNTPALKGIHLSMKSGMLAADAILEAHQAGDYSSHGLRRYEELFRASWAYQEIYEGRNFAQALAKKWPMKFFHLGLQYITKGKGLFDRMPLVADSKTLKPLDGIQLAAPVDSTELYDGELYVDKLTGVYLSKTMHREDQPPHLIIHDRDLCADECYENYANPCTRFCPGNVYEVEVDEETSQRRIKLNPSNCFHCKTCDIKDPYGNITWTCPEGGEGPGYTIV
jgi:electron-transferring-flavoprotein dehydrogenase